MLLPDPALGAAPLAFRPAQCLRTGPDAQNQGMRGRKDQNKRVLCAFRMRGAFPFLTGQVGRMGPGSPRIS